MKRKGPTKKIRFEVFKRDSFTCQYCGKKAPDVVLHVDHIEPISKDGDNNILNLITACDACNAGKGDRRLNDSSIIDKQRKQLEELQSRKEQIEMLLQWQKELLNLKDYVVDQVADYWSEQVDGYSLNEHGIQNLKKLLKRFSPEEVMTAIKDAAEQYLERIDDKYTQDSVEKAWDFVGRICAVNSASKTKPYMKELFYIRGILRKRMNIYDKDVMGLLERAAEAGVDVESLKSAAKEVRNWYGFRSEVEFLIGQALAERMNNNK